MNSNSKDAVLNHWTMEKTKDAKVYIKRYLGEETEIQFPEKFEKKKISGITNTNKNIPDNYKRLKRVVIPEGYTSIGDYAFYGCELLETVVLPKSLKSIGKSAFEGCKSLVEITIPEKVKIIQPKTFYNCWALEKVQFSDGIKEIYKEAFRGCRSLTHIELPNSLATLGKACFVDCGLNSVVINSEKLKPNGTEYRDAMYDTQTKIKCFDSSVSIYCPEGALARFGGISKKNLHVLSKASVDFITESKGNSFLAYYISGSKVIELFSKYHDAECLSKWDMELGAEEIRLVMQDHADYSEWYGCLFVPDNFEELLTALGTAISDCCYFSWNDVKEAIPTDDAISFELLKQLHVSNNSRKVIEDSISKVRVEYKNTATEEFAIYEYNKSEKIDEMIGYLEKNIDLGEDLY